MLKFISSLSNRTFQVRVGSTLSMTKQLDTGTPQGSILSPILFTIVINDLPGNITSSSTLYVDEFCFWESGSYIEHLFERCQDWLSKVKKWCTKWDFKLSVSNWQQFSLHKKETKLTFFDLPKRHSWLLKKSTNFERVQIFGCYFSRKRLIFLPYPTCPWQMFKTNERITFPKRYKLGAEKRSLLDIYRPVIEYGTEAYFSLQ